MTDMEGTSTTTLVARALERDQSAWDDLVDRYTRLVWHVVLSFRDLNDASQADAHQTTWLRLAENLARIHDPERLGSWLATTARRECIRLVAAQKREAPTAEVDPGDSFEELDRHLLADERDADLWRAFRQLDEDGQRLLRFLLADPPFSYDEIAVLLDMKRGSIGPTRRRCLDALKQHLRVITRDGTP